MNLEGKRVLVVGAGKSGIAAARLLLEAGAAPVRFDANEKTDIRALSGLFPDGANIRIRVGTLPEEEKEDLSLVVMSPGVPVDTPFVEQFADKAIHDHSADGTDYA